jgi:hypothetical protein
MNNPPAFPVQSIYIEDQETNSRGMTLRDYFAAKAMANAYTQHDGNPNLIAKWAYEIADEMLKAREQ